MPLGGIITILVLLPNLLVIFYPPAEVPPENCKPNSLARWMVVLERAGQIGTFVIPFFYVLDFDINDGEIGIGLGIIFLALVFYYTVWARYLLSGHKFELLYKPFLGFPLPLAVCPIIYFLAASILLRSPYLALAVFVLAVGHIYVSFFELKRVIGSEKLINSNDLD